MYLCKYKKRNMSGNALKVIAIIAMTITSTCRA